MYICVLFHYVQNEDDNKEEKIIPKSCLILFKCHEINQGRR